MNQDAEKWLAAQNCTQVELRLMRDAMRWAYADAAKVALETRSELGAEIAQDIEARMPPLGR